MSLMIDDTKGVATDGIIRRLTGGEEKWKR